MKLGKEHRNGIIICLLEVLLGVLLLIDPVVFTAGILIVMGALLVGTAVVFAVRYFKTAPQEAAQSQLLLKALLLLTGGGFCILWNQWFVENFSAMTIFYGVLILLAGLGKLQWAADTLRLHNQWLLPGISAAVSVICAVIVLCSPFATTDALLIFTGICLVVAGIFDVVALLLHNRAAVTAAK